MVQISLDFRSDTATRPTPAMREVMARAEVGDDVLGEDPAVNALQEHVATLLGKEAALFVPSGTMGNQIGIRLHCQPGDEFLCEADCHVYNYEQAGFAQLHGIVARTVQGEHGVLDVEQLRDLIRPDNIHLVRTRLVSLENTHNRGCGRAWPVDKMVAICEWAHEHGLATHLDGARLWNAAVASGRSLAELARHFDTISVCFSKGLGAPVGSALVGTKQHIHLANRYRKVLGGGMRQAGVIAAAAHYALEHHLPLLAEDHRRARQLAQGVARIEGLKLARDTIDSNIVIFRVSARLGTSSELAARLKQRGLLVGAFGQDQMRMVTHLDLAEESVPTALEILADVCRAEKPVAAGSARGAYA